MFSYGLRWPPCKGLLTPEKLQPTRWEPLSCTMEVKGKGEWRQNQQDLFFWCCILPPKAIWIWIHGLCEQIHQLTSQSKILRECGFDVKMTCQHPNIYMGKWRLNAIKGWWGAELAEREANLDTLPGSASSSVVCLSPLKSTDHASFQSTHSPDDFVCHIL